MIIVKVLAMKSKTFLSVCTCETTWGGNTIRQMALRLSLDRHELGVVQIWRQQLVFWLDVLLSRRLHGMMYYLYVALEIFWGFSRPGLRADGWDSLCGVSLWARLFWSVQSVADTQGKGQACLPGLTYLLCFFPLPNLKPFLRVFHAHRKLRWPAHMFFFF